MNTEQPKKENRKNLVEIRNSNKFRPKLREYSKDIDPKSIMIVNGFDFASNRRYIRAVSKIYCQEVNDIDRFVNYAETLAKKRK